MKTIKINLYLSTALSVISLLLMIELEFDIIQKSFNYRKLFHMLIGHGNFINNIIIGIFVSSILIVMSSIVSYRMEYKEMTRKLIGTYAQCYWAVRSGATESEYDRLIDNMQKYIVSLEKSYGIQSDFSPIRPKMQINKNYKSIIDMLFMLHINACTINLRVSEVNKRISEKEISSKKLAIKKSEDFSKVYFKQSFEKLFDELDLEKEKAAIGYNEIFNENVQAFETKADWVRNELKILI